MRGSRLELLSGYFDAFLLVLVAQEQIGRRPHGQHLFGVLNGNAQLGHEVIVHGGGVIVVKARLRDKTLQENVLQALVPVSTAEQTVAVDSDDLDLAGARLENGRVEGTAAEVEDE